MEATPSTISIYGTSGWPNWAVAPQRRAEAVVSERRLKLGQTEIGAKIEQYENLLPLLGYGGLVAYGLIAWFLRGPGSGAWGNGVIMILRGTPWARTTSARSSCSRDARWSCSFNWRDRCALASSTSFERSARCRSRSRANFCEIARLTPDDEELQTEAKSGRSRATLLTAAAQRPSASS